MRFTCSECSIEFNSKHRRSMDLKGVAKCERCKKAKRNARHKERYYNDPEYRERCRANQRNADKKYSQTEHGKEKNREQCKLARETNPERARERDKRYREKLKQENPELLRERYRIHRARRRARLRTCTIESFTHREIFERDKWICHICKKKTNKNTASLDHVIPLSMGGTHERANVKCAHKSCNSSKNNRTVEHGEQLLLIG